MQKQVVSVPGKVILAGEYSVLAGQPALACAVQKRMTIEVAEPDTQNKKWNIESCLWDKKLSVTTMDLIAGNYSEECSMVCATLTEAIRQNPDVHPLSISIACDWPIAWGLGSSSALRLGLLAALKSHSPLELVQSLQQKQQGLSSGCDAFVQFHGGIWSYQMHGRSKRLKNTKGNNNEALDFADKGFYFFTHPKNDEKSTKDCIQGVIDSTEDAASLYECSHAFYESAKQWLIEGDHQEKSSIKIWKNLLRTCSDLRRQFQDTSGYTTEMAQLARLPGLGRSWEFKGLGAWGPETFLVLSNGKDQTDRIRTYLSNMGCKEVVFKVAQKGLKENLTP